jgi:hypothetical protein
MTVFKISRRIRYIDRKLERALPRKKAKALKTDRERLVKLLPRIVWVSSAPINGPAIKVQGTFRYEQ